MVKKFLFGTGGGDKLTDIGLLVLRLFFGLAMCLGHGIAKIQKGPQGFVENVSKMDIPLAPAAGWGVLAIEVLGSLLIVLGVFTRLTALASLVVMLVAAFVVHANDPFSIKEKALAYAAVYLTIVFTGAGRISIDKLISK